MALNARTILTGRVTQQGDMLTIQAELVDTARSRSSGANSSATKLAELMTVQEEIAWQISEALRLKLTTAQKKKLRKRRTVDPEAYQEYLRGRHYWNNWTPDGFRPRGRTFPARDRPRPDLRARLCRPRRHASAAMSYYGYIDAA